MKATECRWRLSTIRQSYDGHMDKMLAELDELERLARIGKATEKAFENDYVLADVEQVGDGKGYHIECHHAFGTIKRLLEWAESED